MASQTPNLHCTSLIVTGLKSRLHTPHLCYNTSKLPHKESQMQKLPIGIQTFRKIREDNYLYVDKTEIAHTLIENYQYVFLARPRRFGKSLFLDTLQNIFEGNKPLFEGLAIYDKWQWERHYPVIKLSFAGDFRSPEATKAAIMDVLRENQRRLGVVCDKSLQYSSCFRELIYQTREKYQEQVVILVDEYDKAILDAIDLVDVAKENREIVKALYSIIKEMDTHIRFVFLTGVSKFSKASIFSGLNMLTDISLHRRYGNICGYTQHDLETKFRPHLEGADMQRVKAWYNGYSFLGEPLYNPFDILQFIDNAFKFSNYWFATGTPSFLIKLIKEQTYYLPRLSNLVVGEELLESFDVEHLKLEVVLYQAGYLTIGKTVENRRGGYSYHLRFPNIEVKTSFNDFLIDYLTGQPTQKYDYQDHLHALLAEGHLEALEETLTTIFASIPYNHLTYIKHYEGFYASILYIYLQSLGIEIIGEDVTNRGRIDLTLFVEDKIYIMEFKVGSDDALAQIKAREYAQKYRNRHKALWLVGINFDADERNVSKVAWERG